MKKILLAIDGEKLNINSVEFACFIAKMSQTKLVGVFLEQLDCEEIYVSKPANGRRYVGTMISSDLPENETVRTRCEESIRKFKEACISREVEYLVHRDRGIPLQELVTESRFADLMIMDADLSLKKTNEHVPAEFAKDVLAASECPVIIAPQSFTTINEIVFAYNGSASSVFAMKQFTYLFPELRDKKIAVVEVTDMKEGSIDEKYKIKEWLKMHYNNIDLYTLEGDAGNELMEHMLVKENVFIVMGAYGRTLISNYLHSSTANQVLKFVSRPVFIAHY